MSDYIGQATFPNEEGEILKVRQYISGVDLILPDDFITLTTEQATALGRWLLGDDE